MPHSEPVRRMLERHRQALLSAVQPSRFVILYDHHLTLHRLGTDLPDTAYSTALGLSKGMPGTRVEVWQGDTLRVSYHNGLPDGPVNI